jgi:hypothetical protein
LLFSLSYDSLLTVNSHITFKLSPLGGQHPQAQNAPTMTSTATSTTSSNMSVYQNSTYGIKIQYPSDWLYRKRDRTNIVTFIPPSEVNLILKSIRGNVGKSLTNNTSISPLVTIGLQVLPFYNLPLSLFSNLTINSLKVLPSFHLIQPTTLGGNPANLLVYSQDPIYSQLQRWFTRSLEIKHTS